MKKFLTDEKKKNLRSNLIILSLILVCVTLFYHLFENGLNKAYNAFMAVFIPALIGLFVSYICEPLFDFLNKKCKFKKPIAVAVTAAILIALVIAIIFFVGKFIYEQTVIFINEDWPKLLAWINNWATNNGFKEISDIVDRISNSPNIADTGLNLLGVLKGVFQGIKGFLLNLALTFIFFLYFLYSRGKIFKGIIKFFPKKTRTHLLVIGSRSDDVIHSFVRGKFIAILVLMIFFVIGFEIIGLKSVGILFAILLACLDIVPIVGPIIGTIFPMLYTFMLSDQFYLGVWTPVLVLIIVLLGQLLQEKVISPLVIGKSMNINSLLLLCAMVFFGSLFGVLGIVLAIPICGVIKVVYTYLKEILFVDDESDKLVDLSDRIAKKITKEENNVDNN